MTEATKKFHVRVLRLLRGLVNVYEDWVNEQPITPA